MSDLVVVDHSLADVEQRIDAMRAIGYHYVPQYEDEMPGRRYFRRPDARPRSAVEEYGALKRHLAVEFAADRAGCTDANGPFIERALEVATALHREGR